MKILAATFQEFLGRVNDVVVVHFDKSFGTGFSSGSSKTAVGYIGPSKGFGGGIKVVKIDNPLLQFLEKIGPN